MDFDDSVEFLTTLVDECSVVKQMLSRQCGGTLSQLSEMDKDVWEMMDRNVYELEKVIHRLGQGTRMYEASMN
jgi:hypothetical protein